MNMRDRVESVKNEEARLYDEVEPRRRRALKTGRRTVEDYPFSSTFGSFGIGVIAGVVISIVLGRYL